MRGLPNAISIFRLVLVPVSLGCLYRGDHIAAFLAFLVAGVSDAADGYIARRWNLETALGRLLDPLADKVLLVGMMIALGWLGLLPVWLVALVVARDVAIVLGVVATWVLRRPIPAAPSRISKANTFAQMALCGLVLLDLVTGWRMGTIEAAFVAAVCVLTVLSAALYARVWLAHLARQPLAAR